MKSCIHASLRAILPITLRTHPSHFRTTAKTTPWKGQMRPFPFNNFVPFLTLPSECVSLSGRVLGNLHPTPWSSWRWKCGNRRSDFQGLWEGWENSLIVFPGFPQAAISMACLNRSRRHAAIFAEAPIQSCSNSTGLT
jgi:hypothetical protein